MINPEKILKEIGVELIIEMDDRLSNRKINNTKTLSQSLKEKATFNNLRIVGLGRIRFVDIGRRPGKFAPPGVIQEWVRSKLNISDEKKVRSIASLINRKLAVDGNRMYIDKTKGVQLNEIAQMGVDKIKERIPAAIKAKAKAEIKTIMQGA